jgi:peptidoglycan/xylan/chitin deacetylase (PgdA/CDA1 family)
MWSNGQDEGLLRILYHFFFAVGGDKFVWKLDFDRLRILCYHGLCADHLANEPWVPHYFVTESAFAKQLQYLTRTTTVLPLSQAVLSLRDGTLPPRCVSLTFDDGYANNLELAYPILRKYGVPATIFLSTSYMESGEFFPFLKLKLMTLNGGATRARSAMADYKTAPLSEVDRTMAPWWPEVRKQLSDDQLRTLRPLSVSEVKGADMSLVDFGPHTHTHCILRNESAERRQEEIRTSIRKVSEWLTRPVVLFSFTNGQRGDFDEADKQVLREEGIQAAVTGIGGANSSRADLLELRRYPISLHHDEAGFCAEVTGFRSALLTVSGRRA